MARSVVDRAAKLADLVLGESGPEISSPGARAWERWWGHRIAFLALLLVISASMRWFVDRFESVGLAFPASLVAGVAAAVVAGGAGPLCGRCVGRRC